MSWRTVALGDVVKVNPRLPKDTDESQLVTFLKMAYVSEQGELLEQESRVLSETKKGFTYFERDDVLLAKITPCFENGKAALVNKLNTKIGFGSTEFHVLRPIKGKIDNKYLFFLVWNEQFRFLGEHAMKGAAGQQRISADFLKSLKIPLPPLEIQKQIAAVLEKADQLRKDCQQMEQELNSLAQSVFIDMFGDPLVNEKDWNVNSLEELTMKITDGKHGDCVDEEGSGYYFVSAKNIRYGKIDFSGARQINKKEFDEVHRRTDLKPGDLVMINTGATIGRLAIASSDERTQRATFQKSVAVIKPNTKVISIVFLKYVFMLRVNDFAAVGSGSAIKNLLLSQMKSFQIITPPLVDQNKFTEIEQMIQENIGFIGEEHREAESNFNSLMQKAFKGELNLKSSKTKAA